MLYTLKFLIPNETIFSLVLDKKDRENDSCYHYLNKDFFVVLGWHRFPTDHQFSYIRFIFLFHINFLYGILFNLGEVQ